MKNKVGRYPKDYVVTEEEIKEIKRINRERLDYIISQGPEYQIELAVKYYGDNWMTVFGGEQTYLHAERVKYNQTHTPLARGRLRERPIQQLDLLTGDVLETYENSWEVKEKMNWTQPQMQTMLACLTGRYDKYMGYKWKFADADEREIPIYGID